MSLKVSGFIKRLDYSDKFGNFTPTHSTFGKLVEVYNPNTAIYNDFEIVSLNRIKEDDTHSYAKLPSDDMADITNIVDWLFKNAATNLTSNVDQTNAKLAEEFGTAILTVVADTMITDGENNILPNRIQIDINRNGGISSYTYWINSSRFDDEYNAFDTTIFIPTATVDGLVTSKDSLEQIINSKDIDDYNNELNKAGLESPYTSIRSLSTAWVNKDNPSETMSIRFTFACYGPINDDLGILKQALRQHILANTSISEAVWERVLPEIFTATTFIMVPAWDYVSGGLSSARIYNPLLLTKDGVDFYNKHLTEFTTDHLYGNMEILPVMWQSLGIFVCANPNNPVGAHTLRENIADYILTDVGSGDFIRLTTQTKDFVVKINNYLPIIEKYKAGDTINDLTLEVIDNLNFLVFTSFNVKCKILCKEDYMALLEEKK